MKRLSLVLMSVALVLGMAQCKKNNEVITSGVADGTRTITLKVSDNGSKISVNPNTGAVGFTKGDKIYAAYNGRYAGTLTHDGTDFTGAVTTSGDSGAKLTFYFMGNKTPDESLTTGASGTQTLTVNIFDQTESYPVISVGLSNETYPQDGDVYTATLNNQCALVKFNVTTSSAYAPTIIAGVNDKVSVTFAAGAIGSYSYSQHRGAVKVAGGSGERWAILLPNDASGIGVAYSGDLRYNGTHGMIPAIVENGYLTAGIDVSVANALSGFTVAAGTVRFFAPGNLQYIGSAATPYWKFADNQYDIIGGETGSGQFTTATNVDRDLFGWGCTGYQDTRTSSTGYQTNYYPWSTSSTAVESTDTVAYNTNRYGYGPDYDETNQYGLTVASKSDWGCLDITNGYGKSWYTLYSWIYVLSTRSASTIGGTANARYGRCYVNGRYGFMIFPDDFTWPTAVPEPTANVNGRAPMGAYTAAQWTLLEANGAVVLPAIGWRIGTESRRRDTGAFYWAARQKSGYTADHMYFYDDGGQGYDYPNYRSNACAVRLVSD